MPQGYLRIIPYGRTPTNLAITKNAGAGGWAGGGHHFCVAAVWDSDRVWESDTMGVLTFSPYSLFGGSEQFMAYLLKENFSVTATDSLSFSWSHPANPTRQPDYYLVLYQTVATVGAVHSRNFPWFILQATGYANGRIPGHLTSAVVPDDVPATGALVTSQLRNAIDSSPDYFWCEGNHVASLPDGTSFDVIGGGPNAGSYTTSQDSILRWNYMGEITEIRVAGAIPAPLNVEYTEFVQYNQNKVYWPVTGDSIRQEVIISPVRQLDPVGRQSLTEGWDNSLQEKSYTIKRNNNELSISFWPTSLDGIGWNNLQKWKREGVRLRMYDIQNGQTNQVNPFFQAWDGMISDLNYISNHGMNRKEEFQMRFKIEFEYLRDSRIDYRL